MSEPLTDRERADWRRQAGFDLHESGWRMCGERVIRLLDECDALRAEVERRKAEKGEAEAILGWAGGSAAGLIGAAHNATSGRDALHAKLADAREAYARAAKTIMDLRAKLEAPERSMELARPVTGDCVGPMSEEDDEGDIDPVAEPAEKLPRAEAQAEVRRLRAENERLKGELLKEKENVLVAADIARERLGAIKELELRGRDGWRAAILTCLDQIDSDRQRQIDAVRADNARLISELRAEVADIKRDREALGEHLRGKIVDMRSENETLKAKLDAAEAKRDARWLLVLATERDRAEAAEARVREARTVIEAMYGRLLSWAPGPVPEADAWLERTKPERAQAEREE